MTCYVGEGIAVCTGRRGTYVGHAACPWCSLPGDPLRRVLETPVLGGYCGADMVCGNCGQK